MTERKKMVSYLVHNSSISRCTGIFPEGEKAKQVKSVLHGNKHHILLHKLLGIVNVQGGTASR